MGLDALFTLMCAGAVFTELDALVAGHTVPILPWNVPSLTSDASESISGALCAFGLLIPAGVAPAVLYKVQSSAFLAGPSINTTQLAVRGVVRASFASAPKGKESRPADVTFAVPAISHTGLDDLAGLADIEFEIVHLLAGVADRAILTAQTTVSDILGAVFTVYPL